MPHLGDGLGLLLRCNLGLIIQAFRVVGRPHLDGVVLEERVIEGRLVGDVHAVYEVTVWALLVDLSYQ